MPCYGLSTTPDDTKFREHNLKAARAFDALTDAPSTPDFNGLRDTISHPFECTAL
ncbi:hypothetical protein SAMN02746095_02910 [Acidocella aminolytica 101 = DSM 11237]|nr:hypothetical protein SAMN02746095_02910 [Acidocella aminolytica 101 = DSM 11237]